jgi:hypothetical protein
MRHPAPLRRDSGMIPSGPPPVKERFWRRAIDPGKDFVQIIH